MATIAAAPAPGTMSRVAGACFIGTAIEWYDFFIYGLAAALVFGPLFFPDFSTGAGTLAAFGTFAVGFLARPLGGAVMGHFGDRRGRKSMLTASLMLMGLATLGIGLLPTYEQIGIWAPVSLVLLRFVQGIGIGGEWGGAVLVAVEHAPAGRRGFYGSFPQMGVPAGVILSNLVFLGLGTLLTDAQFAAWGWRLPFVLSAGLVAIGLYVRLRLVESPVFAREQNVRPDARLPLAELLRAHWRTVLLVAVSFMSASMLGYVVLVYVLSYGTSVLGMTRSTVLLMVLLASVAQLFALPAVSALSDRLGRRRVFAAGAIASAAWAVPMFLLVDSRDPLAMLLALTVAVCCLSAMQGPQAAIAAELFPTRVRYSGASLGFQFSAVIGGGMAPVLATALFAATGTSMSTALYIAGFSLLSLLAILAMPETFRTSLVAVPVAGRQDTGREYAHRVAA